VPRTGLLGQSAVHHGQPRQAPQITLGAEPTLSIGDGEGPEHELFRVADAFHLIDGRLAILNSGTREVRIFSTEGRHLASFGREGEGPGEFMLPTRMFPGPADSILVWDDHTARVTVLTPDQGFARTIRLDPLPRGPKLVGVAEDGRLLVTGMYPDQVQSGGITRIPQSYFIYSSSGEKLDSLGLTPGMAGLVRPSGDAVNVILPLVAPTTTFSLARGVLWLETGEVHGVEAHMLESGATHVITWTGPDLEMTDKYVEAIVNESVQSAPNEETRRRLRASYRQRPVPERIPATEKVLADELGRGWVELAPIPGVRQSGQWLVLSPSGDLEGRLVLSSGTTLLSPGEKSVLLLERDPFGIEIVRAYTITGGL